MATVYSDQYGKTFENPARRMDSVYEGQVKFISDVYTLPGAVIPENTIIDFGLIPAGAKVLNVYCDATDMGGSTVVMDVGYTGADNAFFNDVAINGGVTANSLGATTVGVVTAAAGKQLIATIKAAATTATTGTIAIVLTYILD